MASVAMSIQQWTISSLCMFVLYFGCNLSQEHSESVCQGPWVEQHVWPDDDPTDDLSTSGSQLREDILVGKPARVVIQTGTYVEIFELNSLSMNEDFICGQTVERVTYPLGPDAELRPLIVCTDGFITYLNMALNSWRGSSQSLTWVVDKISFQTRDYDAWNYPVTSRFMDGSSDMQGTDASLSVAFKSEMRGVMRDKGYVFKMDNVRVDYDSGQINGQSLNHISQTSPTDDHMVFETSPYHWLSSWDTSGRRDSSRWTFDDMQALRHTNDQAALQWYADSCWTLVYQHDATGRRLAGSLDMLIGYIRMGHRVRVYFDGFAVEADTVVVTEDDIVMVLTSREMARRGGDGPDKTFFNTKTRQVYRLIHTTGEVRSYYFFISGGQLSQVKNELYEVTWSVDTRPWSPTLGVADQSKDIFGSTKELAAVANSTNQRVLVEIKETRGARKDELFEMYLKLDNLRIFDYETTEPNVVGQSLRSMPFISEVEDGGFELQLYRPVKQYIEVSSLFGISVHQFDMETREYRGSDDWQVQRITWFQDGSLHLLGPNES